MKTNFTNLTTEEKTVWSRDVWKTARNNSFLHQFMGKGHNAMIQRITDLKKSEKGARAVMTLVADMTGDGVTGDYDLEGNEEELKAYDTVIQIDQLRNAARHEGRMADQKTVVNFRSQAKDKLGYWLADRIDQMGFLQLSSLPFTVRANGAIRPVKPAGQNLSDLEFALAAPAPSANRQVHVTDAGIVSGSGFDAVDGTLVPLSYRALLLLKAKAKDEYIRGIKAGNGEEVFQVFVTPQGMAQLRLDSDFMQNVRHAWNRGSKNPLFAGTSSVLVDGMMVHEYRHVYDNTGAANGSRFGATSGNDNGQRVLFCGAQAMGFADIGNPTWVEETFDYGNQHGISVGKIFGMLKPQFKGNPLRPDDKEDFGVMIVDTAV